MYIGRHHCRKNASAASPVFPPFKLLLSQPAEQKAAARISIGTLTVAQHKQRIGAASLKVSAAPLPVCLAAPRPAPARLTRHSDAGPRPPAKKHTDVSGHYLWLLMAPVIGDTYTGTLYTLHTGFAIVWLRPSHRVAEYTPRDVPSVVPV